MDYGSMCQPCAPPQNKRNLLILFLWLGALLVKCLACQHEDPYSKSSTHPGTMTYTYKSWGSQTGLAETEVALKLSGQESSLVTINLGERLCCKEVDCVPENDTQDWLTSKCTHAH